MKNKSCIIFFLSFFFVYLLSDGNDDLLTELYKDRVVLNKNLLEVVSDFEWTIIGGGPAGIIAVAILIDLGIPAKSICWIDPLFNVGRIGEFYENVTGNTPNKFWVSLLKSSSIIEKVTKDDLDYISSLDPQGYNSLNIIVKPFQKVTDYFRTVLHIETGYTDSLDFFDCVWHVGINKKSFSSRNVILATGCRPIVANYTENNFAEVIPLDYALNPEILRMIVKERDSIGVFGSAHSAILILKYLSEMNVQNVYNFYQTPLLYAIDMGTWTLNNANGLKGETAKWAREVLEKNPPQNLLRLKNTEENRKNYLSACTKIIYAIGYKPNVLPLISDNGIVLSDIHFNPENGIIGPRLFGMGIAFPGQFINYQGNKEQLIGLNSFMRYALSMVPQWIDIKNNDYKNKLIDLLDQLMYLEKIVSISLL